MNESRQSSRITRRIATESFSLEELREAGYDAHVALIEGNIEEFYRLNEVATEGCVLVSSEDQLVELFTEDIILERERSYLADEAREVYAHELAHKKGAQGFGISASIYFKRKDQGKHTVFVHISNDELRAKNINNHKALLYFYWKVMRAPSIKGARNYGLEEKLANSLYAKYAELDKSSFEPLP